MSTPADFVTAAVIGAIVGLCAAVFVVWGTLHDDQRRSSLAQRFAESLILDIKFDRLTVQTMQALGVDAARVGVVMVVVSRRGIQFWSGIRAREFLFDFEWGEVKGASLGNTHGDINAGSRPFIAGYAYQRLAIEVVRDQTSTVVQFPVYSAGFGATSAVYRDTFDLRQLTRQINGYKAGHYREQSAK